MDTGWLGNVNYIAVSGEAAAQKLSPLLAIAQNHGVQFAALLAVLALVTFMLLRNARLPLAIESLRRVALLYLAIFKHFCVEDAGRIPNDGPVILVANHTTSYDPVCLQAACGRRLIRFMQAREFYEQWPLKFLYQLLRVIPVNRTGNDTAGIRTALRTLSAGGCIGIFPEGRISDDGRLHEARQGVALLALMSHATVVPAYIHGTRPYSGMVRDFLQFNRVTVHFGQPIGFDDLAERHRDEAVRNLAVKRIMDGIIALRDASLAGSSEERGTCADAG